MLPLRLLLRLLLTLCSFLGCPGQCPLRRGIFALAHLRCGVVAITAKVTLSKPKDSLDQRNGQDSELKAFRLASSGHGCVHVRWPWYACNLDLSHG